MDILTKNKVDQLVRKQGENLVTIYFPTHEKGVEVNEDQDSLQFKNVVKYIEKQLIDLGFTEKATRAYMEKAHELIDDRVFWLEQAKTLAVFIGKDFFEYYRLPVDIKDNTYIGSDFYIKPLIPLVYENGNYYLLSLAKDEVKLHVCSRFFASEIDLAEVVPTSYKEALKWDDPEESLQHHYGDRASQSPIYHGQGVSSEDEADKDLMRFFRIIDKGLMDIIKDRQLPLVLAGTEKNLGMYRKISGYPNLINDGLMVEPQRKRFKSLHADSFNLVRKELLSGRKRAMERFEKLAGTEKTSTVTEFIIKAGFREEIDALFMINDTIDVWGKYHAEKDDIELHDRYLDGDEKLLNKTAINTLKTGGHVYLVNDEQMPAESVMAAALLRY